MVHIFQYVGLIPNPKQYTKIETLTISIVLEGINNLYLKKGIQLAIIHK